MKANNSLLFAIVLMIACFAVVLSEEANKSTEKKEVSPVVEITPRTFYDVVKKYGRLLLYFYSHKCGHCKDFNLVFEEVAKVSREKGQNFGFVKIDGPLNEEFADTFRMTETPSLYFVEKSEGQLTRVKYHGKRSARAILRYLEKKHQYRARELTQYDAFRELVKKAKKFLIFFGDKTQNNELFTKFVNSALDNEIENIFWTKSDEFYSKYKVDPNSLEVILHSNKNSTLDEGVRFNLPSRTNFRYTPKNVYHLVLVHNRPLVSEFNELGVKGVNLQESNLCIGLYNTKRASHYKTLVADMERTAEKYRADCFFFTASLKSREAQSFAAPLGVSKGDLPAFIIFTPESENPEDNNKYLRKSLNGKMEEGEFLKFFEDFKAGKLQKHILSEPIPKNPIDHHGVYKLVGHSFKDVILNTAAGKHVILNVCSETKRCHNWELRYSRVVKKLRNNDNLFFAKIDLRKNDFEYVNIGVTPTIAFIFDGLNRFENIRIYEGKLTTQGLIEFIDKTIKSKNKDHVLKVEAMSDDKKNDEKEKYSPIKPREESDDADEGREDSQEIEGKMKDLWEGGQGAEHEGGEHVDLDKEQHGTAHEVHEAHEGQEVHEDTEQAPEKSEHLHEGL